jgi:hypothetical protein
MTPLKHYRNSIEQADGRFELERSATNRGNIGDIYLPGKTFSPDSKPDTKWWDGLASGIQVTEIQFAGTDHISFTVTVPEPAIRLPEIAQTEWRLVSAPPSQNGYQGFKAFDGNLNTYYHVPWGNSSPRPHEMIIDLGQEYLINEFYYTANTNWTAPWEGRVADYQVFLSSDGLDWGAPVASGTFFYTELTQYCLFAGSTGRYLKFSCMNSWLGDGTQTDIRTSIAELNLRGSKMPSGITDSETCAIGLSLYPNPVNDVLNVQTTGTKETVVSIYNLNGKLLITKTIAGPAGIDVSGLPAGFYLIKAKTA